MVGRIVWHDNALRHTSLAASMVAQIIKYTAFLQVHEKICFTILLHGFQTRYTDDLFSTILQPVIQIALPLEYRSKSQNLLNYAV